MAMMSAGMLVQAETRLWLQQLLISRRHERLQKHQVHPVHLLLLFLGESVHRLTLT